MVAFPVQRLETGNVNLGADGAGLQDAMGPTATVL
jgi:hypothetical protein